MAKTYVCKITQPGTLTVVSEWPDGKEAKAIGAFDDECATLWKSPEAINATVAILDEQFDIYNGYRQRIIHAADAAGAKGGSK